MVSKKQLSPDVTTCVGYEKENKNDGDVLVSWNNINITPWGKIGLPKKEFRAYSLSKVLWTISEKIPKLLSLNNIKKPVVACF